MLTLITVGKEWGVNAFPAFSAIIYALVGRSTLNFVYETCKKLYVLLKKVSSHSRRGCGYWLGT